MERNLIVNAENSEIKPGKKRVGGSNQQKTKQQNVKMHVKLVKDLD